MAEGWGDSAVVAGPGRDEELEEEDPFGFGGGLDQPAEPEERPHEGAIAKRRRVQLGEGGTLEEGVGVTALEEQQLGRSSAAAAPAAAAAALAAAAAVARPEPVQVQRDPLCMDTYARDPRLEGTTEEALIVAMQAIMATRSAGREHPFGEGLWGIFNASTGRLLTVPVAAIEAERNFLYEKGAQAWRDGLRAGAGGAAAPVGPTSSRGSEDGAGAWPPPGGLMQTASGRPCSSTNRPPTGRARSPQGDGDGIHAFSSRTELLRHLASAPRGALRQREEAAGASREVDATAGKRQRLALLEGPPRACEEDGSGEGGVEDREGPLVRLPGADARRANEPMNAPTLNRGRERPRAGEEEMAEEDGPGSVLHGGAKRARRGGRDVRPSSEIFAPGRQVDIGGGATSGASTVHLPIGEARGEDGVRVGGLTRPPDPHGDEGLR